ncbi:MAG TPA: DUF3570 domain-containing protein [Gammaproteobacteria bacterium]|nr:DUF3570 domain-containing protein [Gammaproteobacteria bacterium]
MQLKHKNIAGLLATATCSLLGSEAVAEANPGWQIDTAVLAYSEKDRVETIEPVISLTRTFEDGRILNFKLVADSLTGASPNGAIPTNVPQTFTRPSGNSDYTIPAGDVPLDDTFKDSRAAFSVQYDFPLNRITRISTGFVYSSEYDYESIGANVLVARDFNNKNTTLTAGFAYASDTLDPEGGIPIAFASMVPVGGVQPRSGTEDDKTVTDVLLGVTQVINRKTLMQLNYSYSSASGYLTDPYKIVSVADQTSGETLDYIYENRPDSRDKHSLYWKTKYHRDNGNIIDVSYRYLWDDWDITSHTFDIRYRFQFSGRHYIEPHFRYYAQEAAEFYQHSLVSGDSLPEYVSADPRLGTFEGLTYGAKYAFRISKQSEFSVRLEYYQQNGDTVGNPIGIQNNYDLFPDLEAIIFQLGYSHNF